MGFDGPEATVSFDEGRHTLEGYPVKVLLLVKKRIGISRVTITGGLTGGEAIWFKTSAMRRPSRTVELAKSAIPPSKHWKQYPSYFYIPEPGCFTLNATWADGSWSIPFAGTT